MELDEKVNNKLEFYEKYYSPTIPLFLSQLGDECLLKGGEPGVCRFCGKSSPSVSFDKTAHALPELIGNKNLFTKYECDACNSKFSLFESHFADYLGIKRTISLVDGKNGVPTYQSRDKKTKILLKDGVIRIETPIDADIVNINKDTKQINIDTVNVPYIPRFAYKALVKMALTLMPEEEICHFKKTLDWLQIDQVSGENFTTNSFQCFKSFAPGRNPLGTISVILFKRKDPLANVPYSSFIIGFQNYTFQIFIPFSDMDDHLLGKRLDLAYFPNPLDAVVDGPAVGYASENLSSIDIVKAGENKVSIGFDEIVQTYPPLP